MFGGYIGTSVPLIFWVTPLFIHKAPFYNALVCGKELPEPEKGTPTPRRRSHRPFGLRGSLPLFLEHVTGYFADTRQVNEKEALI